MILVTGATGRTGSALTRELARLGVAFRAMVRDKVAAGMPDAVEADYADPDSLQSALNGISAAFLVTPPGELATTWQRNFIEAAKRAGNVHIVKLSMLGADANSNCRFLLAHAEAEQALENSGLPWTHLRPNFFMQTAAQYQQGESFYSLMGKGRVSAIDLRDVARAAATVLTGVGHVERVYELTGPEALGSAELAEHLANAQGRRVGVVDLPFDQARTVMSGAAFPSWNIEGILELNEWFETGAASRVTSTFRDITMREPVLFQDFAKTI